MRRLVCLLLLALAPPAQGGAADWMRSNRERILAEFSALLSIPNTVSNLPDLRRNAELLCRMMERRGIRAGLIETPGVPAVVYGELPAAPSAETLVFYAHYDGQPVNPREWETGDPFRPVRKDGRIYARSASDDKGAIMAMLAALDAIKAGGASPACNLKFFFEAEEEAGSPHLARIVRANAARLKADLWFICDGPVHQSGRPQLYFGARGVTTLEVEVYGPARELHSGHYGGWAPNPAVMLAHLVASMRDEEGRVRIDGFYDGAARLSETERRALARTPAVEEALRRELGLGRTEGGGRRLEVLVNEPTLNIRGIRSADTGPQARNVVPSSAVAAIDIRLVKGLTPERAQNLVVEHIRRQGYFVTEAEPGMALRRSHPKIARLRRGSGYGAAKTPMDLPIAKRVVRAVEAARGPVVLSPTLGGSVPLYIFEQELGAPFIGLPIANHDNNQHAANENIALDNLWSGIETLAAVMTMPSGR